MPGVNGKIYCSKRRFVAKKWSYDAVMRAIFKEQASEKCRQLRLTNDCINSDIMDDERKRDAMLEYFDGNIHRRLRKELDYTEFLDPNSENFRYYCSNEVEIYDGTSNAICPSYLRKINPEGIKNCPNWRNLFMLYYNEVENEKIIKNDIKISNLNPLDIRDTIDIGCEC